MRIPITETGLNQSERISKRELEVLEVVAQGYQSKEAANLLFLSKRTVDFHLENVFRKLGVNNRILAVRTAQNLGLIEKH